MGVGVVQARGGARGGARGMVQMLLLAPGSVCVCVLSCCLVKSAIDYSCTHQIACGYGHVLYKISRLPKFAVQKARDVFELNRGVEW